MGGPDGGEIVACDLVYNILSADSAQQYCFLPHPDSDKINTKRLA